MEDAVKQMELGKAPGPDEFTTNFFQACWEMIKEELLEII